MNVNPEPNPNPWYFQVASGKRIISCLAECEGNSQCESIIYVVEGSDQYKCYLKNSGQTGWGITPRTGIESKTTLFARLE